MLRSCYRTKCRFFAGDTTESDIIWYFAKPGASWLPFPTAFNSLNWVDASERVDTGEVGEVPNRPRVYSPGRTLLTPTYTGPCGTAGEFAAGTVPLDTPTMFSPDGIPVCCGFVQDDLITFSYNIVGINVFDNV